MTDIAIRVENLGKRYKIGALQKRHDTLRDALMSTVTRVTEARRRKTDSGLPSSVSGRDNIIWALKDVSFEVKRGEVVGIIGRNGAGRSTLLKILSRITKPTDGWADAYSRMGTLLEASPERSEGCLGRWGDVAREGGTVLKSYLLSSALALLLPAARSARTLTLGRDIRLTLTCPHQ